MQEQVKTKIKIRVLNVYICQTWADSAVKAKDSIFLSSQHSVHSVEKAVVALKNLLFLSL